MSEEIGEIGEDRAMAEKIEALLERTFPGGDGTSYEWALRIFDDTISDAPTKINALELIILWRSATKPERLKEAGVVIFLLVEKFKSKAKTGTKTETPKKQKVAPYTIEIKEV